MFLRTTVCLAACTIAMPVLAAGTPSGPAASAVRQWFGSDWSLGCSDPDGHTVPCGPANEPAFTVLYGNADGGGDMPDAVGIVTFVNDPTGNAQGTAAAAFRRDSGGNYRFVRRLNEMHGSGISAGSPARFGGGKVTVTVSVLQPGDGQCCPTGRRQISLNLR